MWGHRRHDGPGIRRSSLMHVSVQRRAAEEGAIETGARITPVRLLGLVTINTADFLCH